MIGGRGADFGMQAVMSRSWRRWLGSRRAMNSAGRIRHPLAYIEDPVTLNHDYLYDNSSSVAADRLRGLEAVEDSSTIELLNRLNVAPGWHCLEIGAGAGSIARWLAERVGPQGRIVATDIDTRLLDPTLYEVWQHDLVQDALPSSAFDLVHLRHVLIHVSRAKHETILRTVRETLKPTGSLLIEESDLQSWHPSEGTPQPVRRRFSDGIATTMMIYRSRAMNPSVGAELEQLVTNAGMTIIDRTRRTRRVKGRSPEAAFHQRSARQLADSIRSSNPTDAVLLDDFAACFDVEELDYETRATVSVSATNSRTPSA